MQPPEGERFCLTGEFRAVDPPARLAFSFRWEEPDPDDVETEVELLFHARDGSTEVALSRARSRPSRGVRFTATVGRTRSTSSSGSSRTRSGALVPLPRAATAGRLCAVGAQLVRGCLTVVLGVVAIAGCGEDERRVPTVSVSQHRADVASDPLRPHVQRSRAPAAELHQPAARDQRGVRARRGARRWRNASTEMTGNRVGRSIYWALTEICKGPPRLVQAGGRGRRSGSARQVPRATAPEVVVEARALVTRPAGRAGRLTPAATRLTRRTSTVSLRRPLGRPARQEPAGPLRVRAGRGPATFRQPEPRRVVVKLVCGDHSLGRRTSARRAVRARTPDRTTAGPARLSSDAADTS